MFQLDAHMEISSLSTTMRRVMRGLARQGLTGSRSDPRQSDQVGPVIRGEVGKDFTKHRQVSFPDLEYKIKMGTHTHTHDWRVRVRENHSPCRK